MRQAFFFLVCVLLGFMPKNAVAATLYLPLGIFGGCALIGELLSDKDDSSDEAGDDEAVEPPDEDGDGYDASTDCDDSNTSISPGTAEIPYDGIDNDCDEATPDDDLDGDEYPASDDCNDEDATVNPGASEVAYDDIDQNCDGADLIDADGDGYDAVEAGGEDCEDGNRNIHPGVTDDCDGGDEDCDGVEDEDQDGDADGISSCDGDCDDADAAVYPDAPEVASDGIDQDCTGYDLGNCDPDVYGVSNSVYLEGSGDGLVMYAACWDYLEVPEYANCTDDEISWNGRWESGDDYIFEGDFTFNFNGTEVSSPLYNYHGITGEFHGELEYRSDWYTVSCEIELNRYGC